VYVRHFRPLYISWQVVDEAVGAGEEVVGAGAGAGTGGVTTPSFSWYTLT